MVVRLLLLCTLRLVVLVRLLLLCTLRMLLLWRWVLASVGSMLRTDLRRNRCAKGSVRMRACVRMRRDDRQGLR